MLLPSYSCGFWTQKKRRSEKNRKEIEDLKNKSIRCTIKGLKGGACRRLVRKYYEKFYNVNAKSLTIRNFIRSRFQPHRSVFREKCVLILLMYAIFCGWEWIQSITSMFKTSLLNLLRFLALWGMIFGNLTTNSFKDFHHPEKQK